MTPIDIFYKITTILSFLFDFIRAEGWVFALVITLALTWVGAIYLFLKEKEEPTKVLDRSGGNLPRVTKSYAFPQRIRRLALVGIIAIPLLASVSFFWWSYYQSLPADKIIILIANFDGPNPEKYRITETIIERLRKVLKPYDDVHVQALGEAISPQQGSPVARAKGSDQKAAIMLWGWYGRTEEKARIVVHFEILRKPRNLNLRQEDQDLILPMKELESFKIQTRIAKEMSYLMLLTVGLARYEANDYDSAVIRFTEALKEEMVPESMVDRSEIYFFRGNGHFYKGNYQNAIADLIQFVIFRPDSDAGYFNLGTALSIVGDYDRALLNLNKAMELSPDAFTYNNRGAAYMVKSKRASDRANNYINKARRSSATSGSTFTLLGSYYLSEARLARDYARKDLSKAFSLKPEWDSPYVNLGISYKLDGEFKMAIDYLTKAIERNPNNTNAFNSRGNSYFLIGNFPLAMNDFKEILKHEPKNASAYLKLGIIYKKLGKNSQAQIHLKKVFNLTNDAKLLEKAKVELREITSK
jgi:tetratricopeptide (TPR) repeat protein